MRSFDKLLIVAIIAKIVDDNLKIFLLLLFEYLIRFFLKIFYKSLLSV
jgi:hypothetical protein